MPKIKYVAKRFSASSIEIIDNANDIIEEYSAQGFSLTLRQLYYQFVSRAFIPNKQSEYRRLGSVINDARLAGMIDWSAIEDRTRNVRRLSHWDNPSEIVKACAEQYRIDRWANQAHRLCVWIEKDALIGVIEGVCNEFDIPYFSCRGYTSQSEMWNSAQEFKKYVNQSQLPVILHFGDHDPSGIDMSRDIDSRLKVFMGGMEVIRLALNFDQVKEYQPPPNPAKSTDSRYTAYISKFGDKSWELDALEPKILVSLIRQSITDYIDEDAWAKSLKEERKAKQKLSKVVEDLS